MELGETRAAVASDDHRATRAGSILTERVGRATRSSAAKCLAHDLIGPRRLGVTVEGRLVVVRPGEHCQQILEGGEIAIVHGCRKRFLDQMVARDECRVDRTHRRRPPLAGRLTILGKPLAPSRGPVVDRRSDR